MPATSLGRLSIAIVAICLWVLAGRVALADIVGDVSVIDEACVAYETNLAKLRTWVAELEVRRKSSRPPAPGKSTSSSERDAVSMIYDRDLPAYMVRWRCVELARVYDDAKERTSPNQGNEWGEMVVEGVTYKITVYAPQNDKDNHGPNIKTSTEERTKPSGPLEERIVPIELFWYRQRPLSERLRQKLQNAQRGSDDKLEAKKEGRVVSVTSAVTLNEMKAKDELVIDLAKGGMLTRGTVEQHVPGQIQIEEQVEVQVEEVSGVWVPSLITYSRHEVGEDGQARDHHRELRWTKNLVNVEIPRSQFTVDAFREGRPARLLDWETKGITKLPGKGPFAAQQPAAPPPQAGGRSIVWMVAAAIVPLALLALYSWRRVRRR